MLWGELRIGSFASAEAWDFDFGFLIAEGASLTCLIAGAMIAACGLSRHVESRI